MYSVVGADGGVYGPVDVATLRAWIAQGRVTSATKLIEVQTGRVLFAGQSPDLVSAFQSAAPPYVPPAGTPPYGSGVGGGFGSFGASMGYTSPPYAGVSAPAYSPYGAPIASRSKLVAILLAVFCGGIGIHRFYLGYTQIGVIMLLSVFLTCGFAAMITWVVAIVDIVMIANGSLNDADGRPLAN